MNGDAGPERDERYRAARPVWRDGAGGPEIGSSFGREGQNAPRTRAMAKSAGPGEMSVTWMVLIRCVPTPFAAMSRAPALPATSLVNVPPGPPAPVIVAW